MQIKTNPLPKLPYKTLLSYFAGLFTLCASSISLAALVSFSTEIVAVNEGSAHGVGFVPGDPVIIHYNVDPAAVDGDFGPQVGLFDPGVLSMSIEFPNSGLILDFDEGIIRVRSAFPGDPRPYPDEFSVQDFSIGTGASLGGNPIQIVNLYFGAIDPTLFDFTVQQIPVPPLVTGVPFGFDFSELTLDTAVAGGITTLELSANVEAIVASLDLRIMGLIDDVQDLDLGNSFYARLLRWWYTNNLSIALQRYQAGFDNLAAVRIFWFAISVEAHRGQLISEQDADALTDEAYEIIDLLINN